MTTYALVTVGCPHCKGHFLENARLVRPNGSAWCPYCEALFRLDESNDAMRRTLTEARAARRRRRERLAELQSRWTDKPAPPVRPMAMSEVLQALDALLIRMDGLADRKRG